MFASRPQDFAALDRNRDGYVARVEALASREVHKRFAEFDADKDGRLSEQEYVLALEDNQKRILRDALITARVKAVLTSERRIPALKIAVDVDGVRTVDNNIAVR